MCLGVAYVMLLTFGMMILAMPMLCVPMLALGTVGTLLISGLCPALCCGWPRATPVSTIKT